MFFWDLFLWLWRSFFCLKLLVTFGKAIWCRSLGFRGFSHCISQQQRRKLFSDLDTLRRWICKVLGLCDNDVTPNDFQEVGWWKLVSLWNWSVKIIPEVPFLALLPRYDNHGANDPLFTAVKVALFIAEGEDELELAKSFGSRLARDDWWPAMMLHLGEDVWTVKLPFFPWPWWFSRKSRITLYSGTKEISFRRRPSFPSLIIGGRVSL